MEHNVLALESTLMVLLPPRTMARMVLSNKIL